MEKRTVYKISNGLVVNNIIVDPNKLPSLSTGLSLLSADNSINSSIGDKWDGNKIIKAVSIPEVNWKALWLACGEITPESTITDKIAIIIKRQKLIAKKLELTE